MTKLPSSLVVVSVLFKHGYIFTAQKGSHQKYSREGKIVIVPAARKEIPIGTLRSISRQSGIDIAEFMHI